MIRKTKSRTQTAFIKDYCKKCGRKEGLQRHHKIPKPKGGSNKPENLACLCEACHKEWHALATTSILSFEDWLEIPPLNLLVYSVRSIKKMSSDDLKQLTTEDFYQALYTVFEMRKTMPEFFKCE